MQRLLTDSSRVQSLHPNEPSLTVEPSTASAAQLIGGKGASDMQENLEFVGNNLNGTLKYVTGYTQFSGEEELQKGNFMALHITTTAENATIKCGLNPTRGSGMATLDADGLIVLRLADKETQVLEIEVSTSAGVNHKVYHLNGLNCLTA